LHVSSIGRSSAQSQNAKRKSPTLSLWVGDGIAWIRGLPSAAMDDLLDLSDGSEALVFHLGRELLGAGPLRQTDALTAGT
jgi:F0F1-type ATP synthase alpha subunit